MGRKSTRKSRSLRSGSKVPSAAEPKTSRVHPVLAAQFGHGIAVLLDQINHGRSPIAF
jgi:hypothetical protein